MSPEFFAALKKEMRYTEEKPQNCSSCRHVEIWKSDPNHAECRRFNNDFAGFRVPLHAVCRFWGKVKS